MPVIINSTGYTSDEDNPIFEEETLDLPVYTNDIPSIGSTTSTATNYLDYKFILVFGFTLFILALTYIYWIDCATEVPARDETNMTMQYAIDKTVQMRDIEVLEVNSSSRELATTQEL